MCGSRAGEIQLSRQCAGKKKRKEREARRYLESTRVKRLSFCLDVAGSLGWRREQYARQAAQFRHNAAPPLQISWERHFAENWKKIGSVSQTKLFIIETVTK
jgi:hypothetical protein